MNTPYVPPMPDRKNSSYSAARSSVVNRTHRVVRQEALQLRSARQRSRSLWVPVAICSSLLLMGFYAAWSMFDFYDVSSNGLPDASEQLLLMLLWCLPVTALVMIIVWVRRMRSGSEGSR